MANKEQLISALRLYGTSGIGAASYMRLVELYGSEEKAVAELEKSAKYRPWSIDRAENELRQCQEKGIVLLHYSDKEYPQALSKNLKDFPPLLYAKGNLNALNAPLNVAIVGSRSASVYGCKIATQTACELAEKGVCIISGMARGIDGASHQGAMFANCGQGSTVAVLGTGVDVVYPPSNLDIYNKIMVNGCIISEFSLGTEGIAGNFPRRNRLIAGLAQAVLVVEAGLKSGSLITADLALKQHKLLFAVPVTPANSSASGTNQLIKKGALLAEGANDILPHLTSIKTSPRTEYSKPKQKVLVFENNDVKFSAEDKKNNLPSLISFLTVDGVQIDDLIRATGKDASVLASEILDLELSGEVRRLSGGRIALIK